MLDLAILGLLSGQDLHGYELKKRLSDMLGFASGVSFGSLYPALSRLERAGALRSLPEGGASSAPIPLTGSLGGELAALRARRATPRGGRSRKVYSITDDGREAFLRLLGDERGAGEDDRSFAVRLAFAGQLSPEGRLQLLERRRSHLLERRSRLRSRVLDRLDQYASSLAEHDRQTTEHDLAWIEQLIAAEHDRPGASTSPGAER